LRLCSIAARWNCDCSNVLVLTESFASMNKAS
jgi:hypothetical protein